MAAIRHLGFVVGSRGTTHDRHFVVAIRCKNFAMIGIALSCLNFLSFTLESPIHGSIISCGHLAPKI